MEQKLCYRRLVAAGRSKNTLADEIRVRSIKDLREALSTPNIQVQAGLLQAITQRPEEAIKYGRCPDTGLDLVDVLVDLAVAGNEGLVRRLAIGALARFEDPRVAHLFLDFLAKESDPTLLKSYSQWLSRFDDPAVETGLLTILVQGTPDQVRAVAYSQNPEKARCTRERLRFALFRADVDWQLDGEHWLPELQGPFSREMRALLEEAGPEAFEQVYQKRVSLPDLKGWMLEWAARLARPETLSLAEELLEDSPAEALLKAGSLFSTDTLAEMLGHSDPEVQVAAARSGAPTENWDKSCLNGSALLRLAWIERVPVERTELLERLLQDPDWRIRAAARRRMEASV